MKMKTIRHAVSFGLILLIAACSWQSPSRGSLTISFAQRDAGAARVLGQAETLRVYLRTGGEFFPIGATTVYAEQAITPGASSATFTSPALPSGVTYDVFVAAGTGNGDSFLAASYGRESITISAGENTSVAVSLSPSPFTIMALWGRNVTGLLAIGADLYASTANELREAEIVNSPPSASTSVLATLSGYTINSLSEGAQWDGEAYVPEPWLNTDHGIVPYRAGAADLTFALEGGDVQVLQSGSLSYAEGPLAGQVAVYQRDGGLGGKAFANGSAITGWIDIDLSSFLTGKFIYDFVTGGPYGFFATGLGALRIPKDVIRVGVDPQTVLGESRFFTVDSSEPPLPILSLALVGTTLYMGTTNGVWKATINTIYPQGSTTALADTPVQIPGTAGQSIKKIAVSGAAIAFLGTEDLVYSPDGISFNVYPFYSGLPADLPGDLTDICWFDNAGTKYIMISGMKGVTGLAAQ